MLIGFVTSSIARLCGLPGFEAPRRIVDVGAGPAVAACAFAEAFPAAEVTAVDPSPSMLERATRRIETLGLAGRVRTAVGELPDGLAGIDGLSGADVLWASMSLHHVGDEVAALVAMRRVLRPGGVLILAEMAEPMGVVPARLAAELGRPGLGDRMAQVGADWFAGMRHSLPGAVASRDLALMVESAGLVIADDRVERIRLDGPLPGPTLAVAVGLLERARAQLGDRLDADDLAAIDLVLGGNPSTENRSTAARSALCLDASRRVVIAHHPGAAHD